MVLHRLIRFVCLTAATAAPLVAAFICRQISEIAVKEVIPRSGSTRLPAFTEMWITAIAEGRLPLVGVGLLVSVVVMGLGLYVLLSKRTSGEARTTLFALVCSIGFAIATVLLGNTVIGVV